MNPSRISKRALLGSRQGIQSSDPESILIAIYYFKIKYLADHVPHIPAIIH
jgi:hypothetical protein